MPPFGPIKRRDLIKHLRRLGFEGPHAGARHEFMQRPAEAGKPPVRVTLPNPHQGDISRGLLSRILRDAGISRAEWEAL